MTNAGETNARSRRRLLRELPTWVGIVGMCSGVFCITANDALVKSLAPNYSILQILFLRMAVALPLIALVGFALGVRAPWRTRRPGVHLLRGVFAVCAMSSFFLALRLLPLAEANALALTAPIVVSALSFPLLREFVGLRKWLGTVAGFGGVLLIVRPGTAAFDVAALIPLVTAVFYALLMITAGMLDPRESIVPTMFYMTLVPLIVTALIVPWVWRMPAPGDVPAFVGMGILGAAGWTFITQSVRIGPASLMAPLDYTSLIWAGAFGWLIWGEVPSSWSFLGAGVIVASGVYLAYRHVREAMQTVAGGAAGRSP